MSDAFSDIARDQRRSRHYAGYLGAIQDFLSNPTKAHKQAVIKAAEDTDQIPQGFFGGQTSLADGVGEMLDKLRAKDQQVWAKFLFSIRDESAFQGFKKISPFADRLLVSVDYGCGFVTLKGDIEPFLDNLISRVKGWKTFDCDKYLVVLTPPSLNGAQVLWLGCGASGPNIPTDQPRPSNTPPRESGFEDDDY